MSLGEHLDELRRRLIRALAWLAVGFFICYYFRTELLALIAHPIVEALKALPEDQRGELVATEVGTKFFTAIKASLVFGLFLTGPFVVGEFWKFVSPGLYAREKRWMVVSAPLSYLLFAAGGVFFYMVVQPFMLRFFIDFGRDRADLLFGENLPVKEMIDIGRWFTLWLGMALIMGAIFQLPLLMVGAQLTGLVDARTFAAYRRHFIVGSVIAAAFLTPTGDAVTLAMTMVPIVILYEVGLLVCRMLGGGKNKEST
jgi:sec-independent protein translocase protein TatC